LYECYKVANQIFVKNGPLAVVAPISQSKQLCFEAFYQMTPHKI